MCISLNCPDEVIGSAAFPRRCRQPSRRWLEALLWSSSKPLRECPWLHIRLIRVRGILYEFLESSRLRWSAGITGGLGSPEVLGGECGKADGGEEKPVDHGDGSGACRFGQPAGYGKRHYDTQVLNEGHHGRSTGQMRWG